MLSFRSFFNPLETNPTKWSNTLKHFVGNSFECVRPFCEVGAYRINIKLLIALIPIDNFLSRISEYKFIVTDKSNGPFFVW